MPDPVRYTFLIPGEPVSQGRGRACVVNGHARIFDPQKSRVWKALVQDHAKAAGVKPIEGPVAVAVLAIFTRPKTSYRVRDPRGQEPRIQRPDLDNVLKAVTDGLNGVAWLDDAQIARLYGAKDTAGQGHPPGCVVEIWALVPRAEMRRPIFDDGAMALQGTFDDCLPTITGEGWDR